MFVTDTEIPFAGVIAFLGMWMTNADDPVVYLNPYQRWKLPAALGAHETRVWTSAIDRTPATPEPMINALGFIRYPEQGPNQNGYLQPSSFRASLELAAHDLVRIGRGRPAQPLGFVKANPR
jgi:hypothetical protein